MSHFGYPDFDRPTQYADGTIFHSYGAGPFCLAPKHCSVANNEDGRVDFRLDVVRTASPIYGTGHAILELRLNADYASNNALAFLRKSYPGAVLTPCVLTNWDFRLAPGPMGLNMPQELLRGTQLATNNLGSARMVQRLSIESGLILESLLQDTAPPVKGIAEAQIKGISPRVGAVVRFKAEELMPAIYETASEENIISWQSLVNFFSHDPNRLPMVITGTIDGHQTIAFGEAMADRIIHRFGAFIPGINDPSDPLVKLHPIDEYERINLIWSLSQPFMATRRIRLNVDLLSDVRQRIKDQGMDAFVRRHTMTALPSLGQSDIMVFCNLPSQRVGLAAIGATLTFPPKPPDRPHAKNITVLFEPPEDIMTTQVQLAPGEPLNYNVSTFVVISDEHGVREIKGPSFSNTGSPLRLSPEDFPIGFVLVEVSNDLAEMAVITGVCQYAHNGRTYTIPFEMDSGRLSASLALPKDREAVNVHFTATSRTGRDKLSIGPFESPYVRLDLTSFREYGWHEVAFECIFDRRTSVYAIDILPDGRDENFENITILAFTPEQPIKRFGWFADSPFRAGFRYRPHGSDHSPGTWKTISSPDAHLVIYPEPPEPSAERIPIAVSENLIRPHTFVKGYPIGIIKPIIPVTKPETKKEDVPTSPQAEPTDLLLYNHPSDTSKKLYIPQYKLGEQTVSGQPQYRVSMAQEGATATLTIHLVAGPADALREAARQATEYPHEIEISLNFLQSAHYGARKTLAFQEVSRNGDIVTARMTFTTLQERDEVFLALTQAALDTRLIVDRTLEIRVPHPPPMKITKPVRPSALKPVALLPPRPMTTTLALPTPPTLSIVSGNRLSIHRPSATHFKRRKFRRTLPTPVLAFVGKETKSIRGKKFIQANLAITNWEQYSSEFFKPSPDLSPCGRNKNASRTWIDIYDGETDKRLYGFCAISSPTTLTQLWFSVQAHKKLPGRVYLKLNDRRTKIVRKSNIVDTAKPKPVQPVYQQIRMELAQSVSPAPFSFIKELHAYMFQGIVPSSERSGLIRFRLPWRGRHHTYLQDATRPHIVYFVPDQFKIARRHEAPFTPFVTVRILSNADITDTDVVFDYIVAPVTHTKRLDQARAALMDDPAFSAPHIEFQPFDTSDVRFFIDRPTQQGSVREERTDASIVLKGALKDTLVMKLTDFGIIFDAMHRDTASLFLGQVEIEVPNENTEVVPFTARMDDLAGELLLYTVDANSGGQIAVTVTNAIESPIRIDALEVLLRTDGYVSNTSIQGLNFPVEHLAPGDTVHMTIVPEVALSASVTPELTFSMDGIQVISDPAAIWDTILDRSTLEYFNIVTVKALPMLFEPIDGDENNCVRNILVDFEGGGAIDLNKDNLEDDVRINYPIDDVILRNPIDSEYRYTVTVIWTDGREERDPEPRQQSAEIFYVNIQR